jgi:predicted Zn-dependent protease
MIGADKLTDRLGEALALSLGDQAEAVFLGSESGLTRFANSAIHQNVAETQGKVYFRVIRGKKIGVASTNSLSRGDLKRAYRMAAKIARSQKENPDFVSLPGPATYPEVQTFNEATASLTPRQRATKVRTVIREAARKKCTVAGSYASGVDEVAVINTLGVSAYQAMTTVSLSVIAMGDDSSGYAEGLSRNVADVDAKAIARQATETAVRCANPEDLPTGEYEVILDPVAVAGLLEWMNYIGFGSKAMHEGTSFLARKIGQKITGATVSIHDDGTDPVGMAMPFDFEGVPKQAVELITNGVARGVVYDSLWGTRAGVPSTGHALTPDDAGEGALALNLFMAGGESSRDDMISSVEEGLLVTRFHYINGFLDTPNAVLTGMTRDGLMRIKQGKIVGGAKNLRFTDSMLRAFETVKAMSSERTLVKSWWDAVGCIVVPTVHLGSLKFSGKTDH